MGSKQDPRLYVEINRVDEEERMVYGYATTESVDSYETVIDLDRVKEILPEYMKFANIREMHQPSAVGTADSATIDDTGLYLAVKVVDDSAWNKVKEKVYKGFSIGGKKDYEIDKRIYLKNISEISLVDRPSNPDCLIDEFRIYETEADHMKVEGQETPAAETTEVKRGMYDLRQFSELLASLSYLASSAQDESAWEGDNSPIPAKLRTGLELLGEVFQEMAKEEIDELISSLKKGAGEAVVTSVELAATPDLVRAKADDKDGDEGKDGKKPDADGDEEESDDKKEKKKNKEEKVEASDNSADVARSGARNSKKDVEDLQSIHDACTRLGAACGGVEKSAGSNDDIFRVEGLDRDINGVAGAKETIQELVTRLAELEAQPEPSKAIANDAVSVTKEQDNSAGVERNEEVQEPPTTPLEAIQRMHKSGGVPINRL